MHMRLLSYLMEICLSRSCSAGGPDDGCLLPRSERQPEGEREQGYFRNLCLFFLLSVFTIIFQHKDPCTIGSLLIWIRNTLRIGIRDSFKHNMFGSAVTEHCGSVSARVTILKVWIRATAALL